MVVSLLEIIYAYVCTYQIKHLCLYCVPPCVCVQMRTHSQLFRHLVDDIANTMDDFDHPSLGKGKFVSHPPPMYSETFL